MHRGLLMVGSIMGAFAVALGAFGTHGLKAALEPKDLAIYETGIQYHFYHVGAIFITAFLWGKFKGTHILWTGRLFIFGIVFFSGSLYFNTYLKTFYTQEIKWLYAITPLGGLCFIVAWLLLGYTVSLGKTK